MSDYQLQAEQEIWDEIVKNAPKRRYAVVRNARSRDELQAYLPENYRIDAAHIASPTDPPQYHYVISGEDVAGWTLDDYVIPRLASGLIWAKEYPSYHDAAESAASSMN